MTGKILLKMETFNETSYLGPKKCKIQEKNQNYLELLSVRAVDQDHKGRNHEENLKVQGT